MHLFKYCNKNYVYFVTPPSPMKSISQAILKRIRAHGRGWIFAPKDFVDLGNRSAVGLTLWRLTREGKIRRLDRGLYDYPRIHKKLGTLAPNPDDVASALAAKTGSRIQVSGQRAANLLGLSQQVPAQLVYLTDGPPQKISIGSQKIVLRPARPSKFPSAGTPAGLALQAILAMGPNADKDFIVRQLKSALSPVDRQQLGKLIKHAPAWSHKIIQIIERS
jgi:Family of unknown function (DUF6088)